MLIITRKPGDAFIINENIEVTILDVQNDKVRVGINAPRDVQILRKELYETEKTNMEAVQSINFSKFKELKNEIKNRKND